MKKGKTEFEKGDAVKYTGRGFLNYDRTQPNATFENYEGSYDAYITYNGFKVLVYRYEIVLKQT